MIDDFGTGYSAWVYFGRHGFPIKAITKALSPSGSEQKWERALPHMAVYEFRFGKLVSKKRTRAKGKP